ncbi:WD40-repeat-containing domain protein [Fennellomyces sp. T-0311]|nr:WD40-repeat-containing domain protein [Fennellomyces sp. T-0311]
MEIYAVTSTSDGRLYAYCQEQHVVVGSLEDGAVKISMEGHLADVTTIRFFPSNQVLLSGASDFQARIWSVEDGSNPVTLVGHTGGVTDIAIVARGRNVLTSSRDGTVRLWHCGSASTIAVICTYSAPVTSMIVTTLPSHYEVASHQLDAREVETGDKMVIVGLDNGSVRGIHLGTRKELFVINSAGSKVSALEYDPGTSIILVADTGGVIRVYEPFTLDQPSLQWQRSDHAITSLTVERVNNGLHAYVSSADGSIYRTDDIVGALKGNGGLRLAIEYSGNELEHVNSIALACAEPAGTHRLLCCNREGYIK